MNYSPPRGDKTRQREEAQPRKQVPGAEICLLITSLGQGRGGDRSGRGGAGGCGVGAGGGGVRGGGGERRLIRGGGPTPRKSDLRDSGAGSNYSRPGGAGLCMCARPHARMLRGAKRAWGRMCTTHVCVPLHVSCGRVWLRVPV